MARIRSIHPGFWSDETLVSLRVETRLFLIGLWNECDDQGVFEWKPVGLKMRIFPADNFDVIVMLMELDGADVVRHYEINGREYGAVRNFRKFQRPKAPNAIHPIPDDLRTYLGLDSAISETGVDDAASVPTIGEIPPPTAPPISEIPPQMEEEGGGKERVPSSLRSDGNQPRASKRKQVPEGWWPAPNGIEFAHSRGVDPDIEVPRFRDFHASKGNVFADIAAAWRTWCQNHQRFNGGGRLKPNGHGDTLPLDDPTGIHAWIAKQETEKGTFGPEKKEVRCIGGYAVEPTADLIAGTIAEAGGTMVQRPNWDALAGWCRDGLVGEAGIWTAIHRVARSLHEPVRSLAVFDLAIREQCSGRAA